MRRGRLFLAVALLVCAASEARAADSNQLGCPASALSDAERHALGEAARQRAGDNDPRVIPLRNAALACARRWNWSQAANTWAVRFHFSLAGQREQRRRLVAAGVDVEEIGQMGREDETLIASLGAGTFESAMGAARPRYAGPLQRALRGLGEITDEHRGDLAEELGNYLGFVIATEASRRAFIAS